MTYRFVSGLTEAARAGFVRIYEESFPPSERDDTGSLLQSLVEGARTCYLAERGQEVVGLAVLSHLGGARVEFLEYLAVDPAERGQGLGGRFLAHLRGELESSAQRPLGMIWEVEPPDPADGPERTTRERRIAFYERGGAVIVKDAPGYEAPNLNGQGTLPFLLMWLPLGEGPGELRGDLLRLCVQTILTRSYGLAPTDALV